MPRRLSKRTPRYQCMPRISSLSTSLRPLTPRHPKRESYQSTPTHPSARPTISSEEISLKRSFSQYGLYDSDCHNDLDDDNYNKVYGSEPLGLDSKKPRLGKDAGEEAMVSTSNAEEEEARNLSGSEATYGSDHSDEGDYLLDTTHKRGGGETSISSSDEMISTEENKALTSYQGTSQDKCKELKDTTKDTEGKSDSVDKECGGEVSRIKSNTKTLIQREDLGPGPITSARLLYELLERSRGSILTEEKFAKSKQYITRILAKLQGKRVISEVDVPIPVTNAELRDLVDGLAEIERPWLVFDFGMKFKDQSMWRAWTPTSQGKINDVDKGMLAKAAKPLNTFKQRNFQLESHANYRSYRGKTPFLSFTPYLYVLWNDFVPRYKKRSTRNHRNHTTWITQLNVNARCDRGWPILNALREQIHYQTKWTSFAGLRETFKNEALLPFKVHAEDIVWTWRVADIDQWLKENKTDITGWERKVGARALLVYEQARKQGKGCKERRKVVNDFLQVTMESACLIEKEDGEEDDEEDEEADDEADNEAEEDNKSLKSLMI